MILVPVLTTSLIHFSLKGWENVLFELGTERVKPWPNGTPKSSQLEPSYKIKTWIGGWPNDNAKSDGKKQCNCLNTTVQLHNGNNGTTWRKLGENFLLHFAAIVITFCVGYYILRRNKVCWTHLYRSVNVPREMASHPEATTWPRTFPAAPRFPKWLCLAVSYINDIVFLCS